MSDSKPIERDPELEELLSPLDPGYADQTYWPRFQRTVMQRAAAELSRRRRTMESTVSGIVSSWARTLVPTAAAAAAVAGFVLLRPVGVEETGSLIAVEEVLVEGLEGRPIPDVLADDQMSDAGGVVFASDVF